MESAGRSRQTTTAADDVETGRRRRFTDLPPPPPPPQGDANVSPIDAALARRREELLFELHKARIHQDMIFRELVETEFTMGITAAGHNPVPALPSPQDYWRNRPSPSVPPLEESPVCPSPPRSSTERSPSGCRDPGRPVKAPPVYPHVEWPSSPPPPPLLQPRPASDTEKQQDSRSSHPFDGYVELSRSPNKLTLMEEASLPVAVNAAARPIFHEEVTPRHKDVAGREYKVDVEDGHGVQPSQQSGNQSSGQGRTSETTLVEQINGPMLLSDRYRLAGQESAAFHLQKSREFSELKPEQPRLGNGDEQKVRVHAFDGYMEFHPSLSKQAPVEETLLPVAVKPNISPMQSALSFGQASPTEHQPAFGGEPKANVVGGHGMQGDMRNQSSGQRKAMESAMEGQTDKPARPPGQNWPAGQEGYGEECKANAKDGQRVHQSGNQSIGQSKTLETTLVDQINGPMLLSDRCRLAGQETASFGQQEGREFSELKPEQPRLGNVDEQKARVHAFSGYMELGPLLSKQAPVEETLVPVTAKTNNSPKQSALLFGKASATGHQQAFGGEAKANAVDGHGMQGGIRNQRSGQTKAMESALEGRTDKPAQPPPGLYRPAGQENAAYNEQKVEFSESTPERTSNGLKRKQDDSAPLIKKQKPDRPFNCTICCVYAVSQRHLEEHLAGRRHQQMVEALQSSRNHTAESSSTKAKIPVWDRIAAKSTESSHGDGKEKVVAENSRSQQQGGKPHAKAVHAGLKGFNHRKDADAEKKADRKGELHCKVCNVQCNSEKMLASHLGGRKHRERLLEGSG